MIDPVTEYLSFAHLLPEEEKDDAWHLQMQLEDVKKYLHDFDASYELFAFAENSINQLNLQMDATSLTELRDKMMNNPSDRSPFENLMARRRELFNGIRLYAAWCNIAGRDACLTLSNLMDNFSAIVFGLNRCPSLRKLVPVQKILTVKDKFAADFPNYRISRDAAAHPADMVFSREKFEKNSTSVPFEIPGFIKSEGKNTMISPQMIGRSFVTTKLNHETKTSEATSMELFTPEARQKIVSAQSVIYAEFQAAEAHLMAKRRAERNIPPASLQR